LPPASATSSAPPLVSIVVPTLLAGEPLNACLHSLELQTLGDFEVIVVDNSAKNLVTSTSPRVRVISNATNVGFGAAVNQGFHSSTAPYLATLNDDAKAHPQWLEKLVDAAEANPRAGMFASQVMLGTTGTLDSAGMLLAIDGSSKQRGHGESPAAYESAREALFPSGSAALYRRSMLEEVGGFDNGYFLYCEDTDLGLRARWAGWDCVYVAGAIVDHRYSESAGRASPMKAYFVERNRLYTACKTFPFGMLIWVTPGSLVRYFWHVVALFMGRGKTAEYRSSGHDATLLPFLVLRAHVAALFRLPKLLAARRPIFASRRITTQQFRELTARHSISLKRVASL
jgi:GT2 family glycosyltransferase